MAPELAGQWDDLYQAWQKSQDEHAAAEKQLDQMMTAYLEAKGPPPAQIMLNRLAELQQGVQQVRDALDAMLQSQVTELREKHNLPRHE